MSVISIGQKSAVCSPGDTMIRTLDISQSRSDGSPGRVKVQGKRKKLETHLPKLRQLTLKKLFIEQIRKGAKTVEGRPFCGPPKNCQEGEHVRFYYYTKASDDVRCLITKVQKFLGFEEMVKAVGFKACLPDAESEQQAVQAYHKIPRYREKAKQFGVVAIHLQVIEGVKKKKAVT
jgi:ASC-1-like (ASCH) protein